MSKSIIEKLGITPGPWELDEHERRSLMVYSDDALGSRIADCTNHGQGISHGSMLLNVKLIAAAPEMLEALISYVAMMEGTLESAKLNVEGMRTLMNLYDLYVLIIEKATGRTWAEIKELI